MKMKRKLFAFFGAAAYAAAPLIAAAQPAASAGFRLESSVVASGSGPAIVGGLARLPSGDLAVFDGASVVRVDPGSGAVIATLYVPPGPVFGAFLVVEPAGASVLFGESSNGALTRIPLDGSAPAVNLATAAAVEDDVGSVVLFDPSGTRVTFVSDT